MRVIALALAVVIACTACGSNEDSAPNRSGSSSSATTAEPTSSLTTTPPSTAPVTRTPALDAIAVIGHSGATGYDSTGTGGDVLANSWATGTNPNVDSIYERLLAAYPALKDHAYNAAVSGSDSNDMMDQADSLLNHDPVPDMSVHRHDGPRSVRRSRYLEGALAS